MAKANKETVHVVSPEGSGYFYSFRKKKGKGKEKLSLRKYDPVARKHVVFTEKKLARVKRSKGGGEEAAPTENAAS